MINTMNVLLYLILTIVLLYLIYHYKKMILKKFQISNFIRFIFCTLHSQGAVFHFPLHIFVCSARFTCMDVPSIEKKRENDLLLAPVLCSSSIPSVPTYSLSNNIGGNPACLQSSASNSYSCMLPGRTGIELVSSSGRQHGVLSLILARKEISQCLS